MEKQIIYIEESSQPTHPNDNVLVKNGSRDVVITKLLRKERYHFTKEELHELLKKTYNDGGSAGTECINEYIGFDHSLFDRKTKSYLQSLNLK